MTREEAMIHTLVKENDELKMEIGRLRQALEKEPVLDKIRAEIEKEYLAEGHSLCYWSGIDKCLQIIDKYKAEMEVEK